MHVLPPYCHELTFRTQSQKALEDIKWWKEEAIKYHRKIDLAVPEHTVFTNALNEGWGGHFESLSTSARWDLRKIDLKINAKELAAVQKCLEALCADIHSSTILIKSDNNTTVSCLSKQGGCRFSILNDITNDMFL